MSIGQKNTPLTPLKRGIIHPIALRPLERGSEAEVKKVHHAAGDPWHWLEKIPGGVETAFEVSQA